MGAAEDISNAMFDAYRLGFAIEQGPPEGDYAQRGASQDVLQDATSVAERIGANAGMSPPEVAAAKAVGFGRFLKWQTSGTDAGGQA